MSEAAIKAGNAFVEIGLKDKVSGGLAQLEKRFLSWGRGLAAVGGALTAAAGGILAALSSAAGVFANTGSEIYDLSRATGVSADELSALGYAAEQSGASMSDVSGAMRGLGRFTGQVSAGSKQATAALDKLGVSSEEFLKASPYQRFLLIADGLKKIPDPGLRAALGMQTLGRGAQSLGSLLADGAAGVEQLTREAQKLGLVITADEANKADALGDAWGAVGKQLHQVAFVTGSALAEALTAIAQAIQPVLAATIQFIRNNQGLIVGTAIAAAGVGALGVAFLTASGLALGLAVAIKVVTLAMAAYTAVAAAATVVTAALFSPMGLVIASLAVLGLALTGLAGYWLIFGEGAASALSVVQATLNGIFDALVAGRWDLAGKIIGAALNLAFQGAIYNLKLLWIDFKYWVLDLFGGIVGELGKFLEDVSAVAHGLRLHAVGDQLAGGAARTSGLANSIRGAAAAGHDAETTAAQQKLIDATLALANAIGEAHDAREKAFQINAPPVPGFAGGGGLPGSPTEAGFAAGAFNAAVKGLLGVSGETAQQQIANNTARTADAAERTADRLDELDLNDSE